MLQNSMIEHFSLPTQPSEPTSGFMITQHGEEFWASRLQSMSEAAVFPPPNAASHKPCSDRTLSRTCKFSNFETTSESSQSTLLQAAWALLMSKYADADEVVFASTIQDEPAVPMHIRINQEKSVAEYLQGVNTVVAEIHPFRLIGLDRIGMFTEGDDFYLGSLLVVQTTPSLMTVDRVLHTTSNNFPLIINCILEKGFVHLTANYDARVTGTICMKQVLAQFEHCVQQLCNNQTSSVRDLWLCCEEDFVDIQQRNGELQTPTMECLHWHFEKQAATQPGSDAICSWDGNFTYRELDLVSARLAAYLALQHGICPGKIVPVCFPKSAYTVVAMLAILRAGAAYTAIDPSYTRIRVNEILQKTGASVVLAAPDTVNIVTGLAKTIIPISNRHLGNLSVMPPPPHPKSLPQAAPDDVAMILFTSGSTGVPKGIVLEHGQLCKVFQEHGKTVGYCKGFRVLQFSAYTFDVSNSEIFETLYYGGVICIPSDDDRMNDFAGAVRQHDAEYAFLTPSLAVVLEPTEMPSLKILSLGGEVAPPEVFKTWKDHARVIIEYGPAECGIYTSTVDFKSASDMGTIGSPNGARLWIVDPNNHNVLAPVGCPGELIIEGPNVSREYLHDPELTSKIFLRQPPTWFSRVNPGVRSKFYKTNDLVRYDDNGAIRFVARKGTQIKLRGYRIELADVEKHLQSALPMVKAAIAAIVTLKSSNSTKHLASFVHVECADEKADSNGLATSLLASTQWSDEVQKARSYLASQLPQYMIPSLFIPMAKWPKNASWKTDKRRLQEISTQYTLGQLAPTAALALSKPKPRTDLEKTLQELWAQVLDIDAKAIGLDDSFLRIGGNSIQAMWLVGLARQNRLSLTVRDIFENPRLYDLAQILETRTEKEKDLAESISPFSMLSGLIDHITIRQQIGRITTLPLSQIEDCFPCTPLQQGLLALTAKRPGEYVSRSVFCLTPGVDVDRFKQACESVVSQVATLRTRIIDLPDHGLCQVIVNEPLQWLAEVNLDGVSPEIASMSLASPLSTFALGHSQVRDRRYLIWTIHHALYDGWSMTLILDAIEAAYQRAEPADFEPYQRFMKHILEQDQSTSDSFWRNQLSGEESFAAFPRLASPSYVPFADQSFDYHVTNLNWPRIDVTPANSLYVAWAAVQAAYTGSEVVIFGATMSGRQAGIPGLEKIPGPTIATVPLQVKLGTRDSISSLLHRVQAQLLDIGSHEHVGLQNIQRVSKSAEEACKFQTLVVVQPVSRERKKYQNMFLQTDAFAVNGFTNEAKTYALGIECHLEEDGVNFRVNYDANVINNQQLFSIFTQFEHVLRCLCNEGCHTAQVKTLLQPSEEHLRQIWRWNSTLPITVDTSVHDLIQKTIESNRRECLAIDAWDGKMTYGELGDLSTRLAWHLKQLEVGATVTVALCLGKSKWMSVAMLAVAKSGGASVAVDVSQPEERIRSLLHQARPSVILASSDTQYLAASMLGEKGGELVLVDQYLVNAPSAPSLTYDALPPVPSSSLLYMVFTSGSTGSPKAVKITHANWASALHHQKDIMGFGSNSRVYDFSSYSFDVVWSNFLFSAVNGGCLCIPAEDERKGDITASMRDMNVTDAILTPSTARTLEASYIPSLENLLLIGERLQKQDIDAWAHKVNLANIYGPSECTTMVTGTRMSASLAFYESIGTGHGVVTWIVDPDNHSLVPIGAIGELWIEGPLVGVGYVNDPERTGSVFLDSPQWLRTGYRQSEISGRDGRMYRTGDLVKYHTDGSLIFIGRADSQVKIRGQRIELGEIEHHVRRQLSTSSLGVQVMIELITPADLNEPILAAFVYLPDSSSPSTQQACSVPAELIAGLDRRLAEDIPSYMIPTFYIGISNIPRTASGKTDRRSLQAIGNAMTRGQLGALNLYSSDADVRSPTTPTEKQLQGLWAKILDIDPDIIKADASFLRLGGDSIKAMRLVKLAHTHGLSLTVAKVLQYPRLSDLAASADPSTSTTSTTGQTYQPFTLVNDEEITLVTTELNLKVKDLEDVLPVTNMQRNCIDVASMQIPQGCYYFHVDLSSDVTLEDLRQHCEMLWSHISILRTVFFKEHGEYRQIVLKNPKLPLTIYETSDVDGFSRKVFEEDLSKPLDIREPFVKFIVFSEPEKEKRLGIKLSHAHFDGVSLRLIQACLTACLEKSDLPSFASFATYLDHVRSQEDRALAHWKHLLEDSKPIPLFECETGATSRIISAEKHVEIPKIPNGSTPANLFVAACASALASLYMSRDVVFSLVVSGRAMVPVGLSYTPGPCLNIIPVRVRMEDGEVFQDIVKNVQQQRLHGLEYETSTILDILQNCTDWPQELRKYTYTVLFQIADPLTIDSHGGPTLEMFGSPGPFDTEEGVLIYAVPRDDGWNIRVSGNTKYCRLEDLEKLLTILDGVLRQV